MARRNKKMTNVKRRKMIAKANEIFADVPTMNKHLQDELGLSPVSTMEEAIRMIEELYLNIVDFVRGTLKQFSSYQELRDYTLKSKKFYPKEEAKAEGLQHLLIKIF
jgi:hypothetical protein